MRSLKTRCEIVSSARHGLANGADSLVRAARTPQRSDDAETVASELIPLADALHWIGRRGAETLRERNIGAAGRPVWMWGVRSRVRRMPMGQVLILGTWNYPILLTGVQLAQALAAGNRVLVKPAPGCEALSDQLIGIFHAAGVPHEALRTIDSDASSAIDAMRGRYGRVDLVVLTGSAATGRKVLAQAAEQLTASIMELSGVDAVIAMPGSDWKRVVAAVRFGLMFNSGATCIGPRRLFFESNDVEARTALESDLVDLLKETPPVVVHPTARAGVADAIENAIESGATDLVARFDGDVLRQTGSMHPVVLSAVRPDDPILSTDLFAPVISLLPQPSIEMAVVRVNDCSYRLAASVFGPTRAAGELANRLDVGCVTVNDLVAPTADPRLPFGGRGQSGFGVTRGPEGLLAMTTPQVIATRTSRTAVHLSPRNDSDAELLTGVLQMKHGTGLRQRVAAVGRVIRAGRDRR